MLSEGFKTEKAKWGGKPLGFECLWALGEEAFQIGQGGNKGGKSLSVLS